ncbi:MAG: hypothetical protein V8R55_00250 [Dysosmobacter sp.]
MAFSSSSDKKIATSQMRFIVIKRWGVNIFNQQLREFRTTSYKTKHDRRGRPPKSVKNPTKSDGGKEETTNAIENDAAKQKEIGVE